MITAEAVANKAITEINVVEAQNEATLKAAQIRARNRRMMGKSRAAFAKAGVAEGGSVIDVLADSDSQGELDALAAEYSGRSRVTAYKIQGLVGELSAGIKIADIKNQPSFGGSSQIH